LYTGEGPVACAGESGGARYVVLGFELFPFDGKKNPPLSVLTLNLLKWLFQSIGSSSGLPVGSTVDVPEAATSARYKTPTPTDLEILPARSVKPARPGIVDFFDANGGKVGAVAMTFFAPRESNLSLESAVELPAVETQGLPAPDRRLALYYYAALFAMFVLAGDLLRRLLLGIEWRGV
jgi:hypothetical protein